MPRSYTKRFSINTHFKREAIIPIVLFGALLVLAVVMAFVGPWLIR